MDKKVVIIGSAILAFFAGAIWVDQVPVVASLVALLEVCAGFACGFFFKKFKDDAAMENLKNEISALEEKLKKAVAPKKESSKKSK